MEDLINFDLPPERSSVIKVIGVGGGGGGEAGDEQISGAEGRALGILLDGDLLGVRQELCVSLFWVVRVGEDIVKSQFQVGITGELNQPDEGSSGL